MTELEEKFYKTFGIEPIFNFCTVCNHRFENVECDLCDKKDVLEYPPITDHILLELVCILSRLHYTLGSSECINSLKEKILLDCITFSRFIDYTKSDVRKLFEDL